VKCEEDGFEGGCGQRDGTNPDASTFFLDILHSPGIRMPNGTFPKSAPTVRQHRIHRKSGCIGKPARGTTETTGSVLQVGDGKKAVPKQVFHKGMSRSLPNNSSYSVNADYDLSLQAERRVKRA
jgi:hypothetical protein